MYNRYIPQPDGSYRRNRMPDPGMQAHPQMPPQPEPMPQAPPPPPKPAYRPAPRQQGSFLTNLLPPGFDLGDLIVMLLLFLMAGDSQEERNNAILTMALYFIL